MSFSEVLAELPTLTVAERQLLVRRALELDDLGLSPAQDALISERLANHQRSPDTSLSLDSMKKRVRAPFAS